MGLVGFPSVGKSTLLTKLTGTESEAAGYEFTTLTCIPGTFKYKGCAVQLLDLPGIIEGAKDGKGRGKQVIGVARTCGLILIVLDASVPVTHKLKIEHELEGFGIRLNKRPPDVSVKRKDKGGVGIQSIVKQTHVTEAQIRSLCREFKYSNADLLFRQDVTHDELIDVLAGNRMYIPALYVLNMIDKISIEELDILYELPNVVPISASQEWNFDTLLDKIWLKLDLLRIYTKPQGQIPDYDEPVVLPRSKNTVREFCKRIHKTLLDQFKYAWVWGSSVKHNPQKVGLDHLLSDEDVIQIVKKV